MDAPRFSVDADPQISAIPFRRRSRGRAIPVLTASDEAALKAASTLVRLPKGGIFYDVSAPAEAVFNVVQGVLKTFEVLPNATTHVSGFLFCGDIFGLAEQGRYVETAVAIVPVTAFRIPLAAFETQLSRNGPLAL